MKAARNFFAFRFKHDFIFVGHCAGPLLTEDGDKYMRVVRLVNAVNREF